MKIILLQTYENVGNVGEIVNVKNGFARNFLIPKKIAAPATEKNINELKVYLKAQEIHVNIGLPCIADDSGLEVDCLNGEPGVFSARYAGKDCSVEDNINKLLFKVKDFSSDEKTASFKTVLAYVDKKLKFDVMGKVNGFISQEQIGNNGFGYDPIFIVKELRKTYASLSSNQKSKISHRAEAVRNILVKFREFDIIK